MQNTPATCPVRRAMDLLGGKWTPLIVHGLREERLRFAELRRRITGISDKMLTQELRRLEANGLVARRDYGEIPPRVDYVLTEAGRRGLEVVDALAQFGMAHMPQPYTPHGEVAGTRAEAVLG